VARKLKLDYLWIDALCIVQDDDVDKQKEISNLPSIYKNSYVTISAATAATNSEGFLHKRGLPPTCRRFAMRYWPSKAETTPEDNEHHDGEKASVACSSDDLPMFIMDTMHYPTIVDGKMNQSNHLKLRICTDMDNRADWRKGVE
jgi:Heterokaryon incompatibility protein (HET)